MSKRKLGYAIPSPLDLGTTINEPVAEITRILDVDEVQYSNVDLQISSGDCALFPCLTTSVRYQTIDW